MISTGSARIRHSHNDHKEGRIVEKARNGDELGREARICKSILTSRDFTSTGLTGEGEGALGKGRETVLET